jgi:hypothetical protein
MPQIFRSEGMVAFSWECCLITRVILSRPAGPAAARFPHPLCLLKSG